MSNKILVNGKEIDYGRLPEHMQDGVISAIFAKNRLESS